MSTLYDSAEGVRRYAAISKGIDGCVLVDELARHAPQGAAVLELGSGLGKDLVLLAERFEVTGSDTSLAFLAHLRVAQPEAEILELDARTLASPELDPKRRFDALYSNKVLHHLERSELRASFTAQRARLHPGGWALHSFWPGNQRVEREGLLFQEHDERSLRQLLGEGWDVERCIAYSELGHHDSLALLLRAV